MSAKAISCARCRTGRSVVPTEFGRRVAIYWYAPERTHLIRWTDYCGKRMRRQRQGHNDAVQEAQAVARRLEDERLGRAAEYIGAVPRQPEEASIPVPLLAEAFIHEVLERERGRATSTIKKATTMQRFLAKHMMHVQVAQWSRLHTEDVLRISVQAEHTASTSRQVLSILRQTAHWGMRRGIISFDPTSGVKAPEDKTRPVPAPPDHVAALLEAAAKRSPRLVVLLGMMAFGGLRKGEALALHLNAFNLEQQTVHVRQAVDEECTAARKGAHTSGRGRSFERYWQAEHGSLLVGKSGKERHTMLPPHILDALRAVQAEEGVGVAAPLLLNRGSYMHSHSTWHRSIWQPLTEAAGWEQKRTRSGALLSVYTSHSLRHHAASWMINVLRLPPTSAASMLGHSSAAFTLSRYAHAPSDAAAAAAAVAASMLAV